MKLKLVASTKIFKNIGTTDVPMWRCVGGNEYIIDRFDKEPKWHKVGEAVTQFQHILQSKLDQSVTEIYSGFDLYENDTLTHSEFFQLENGGTVDFPAEDLTKIDVTEAMDGLKGL